MNSEILIALLGFALALVALVWAVLERGRADRAEARVFDLQATASRVPSEQTVQGSRVSRAPQVVQARTLAAASARASARGVMSCSRRLSRVRAARRAERGPNPGRRDRRLISLSISGPADAAKAPASHGSETTCRVHPEG